MGLLAGTETAENTILASDLLDIEAYNAGDSTAPAPTSTNYLIADWGIRAVQGNWNAVGERQVWNITQDGNIEVAIVKEDLTTTPVTVQLIETGGSDSYALNLNLDGTTGQSIADAVNELTGLSHAVTDKDDYWLIFISGSRPTNVDLRMWPNDIGDPSDFQDYRYAFRVVQSSSDIATSSEGLSLLASSDNDPTWTPISFSSDQVIDFKVQLRDRDLIRFEHTYSSTEERSVWWADVTAGETSRQATWPSTNEIQKIIFPATLGTTATLQDSNGNPNTRILSWKIYRDAAYGFVVPTGKDLVPTEILTITAPTATTPFEIPTDRSARFQVNVTPGKQLVLDQADITNASIRLLSAIDGIIDAQGIDGQPASVVFTEEDLPGNVSVRGESISAGVWATLAGGLQLIPSQGGQTTITRPFLSSEDGKTRLIHYECWYKSTEASNEASWRESTTFLKGSNSSFVDITATAGYNLQAGYIQHIYAEDRLTGEQWRIKYVVDAGDTTATMDYDYWPESRANPFS